MHRDTKLPALPALTADLLRDNGLLVDNLFADLWKQVGMDALLKRAGFGKRSGTPIPRLAFSLVLWVWLKAGSIALFARESLHVFCDAEKDALYDLMNREDLDWRRLHQSVSLKAIRALQSAPGPKVLVLDGTKIHANASKHKALSWGYANRLEGQLREEVDELLKKAGAAGDQEPVAGMEVGDEVALRQARLRQIGEAKTELKARAEARYQRRIGAASSTTSSPTSATASWRASTTRSS